MIGLKPLGSFVFFSKKYKIRLEILFYFFLSHLRKKACVGFASHERVFSIHCKESC